MKKREYIYTRDELAEAAGVTSDVVRMEERRGTFDTLLGLSQWVIGKKLLSDAVLSRVCTAVDIHYTEPEEYA